MSSFVGHSLAAVTVYVGTEFLIFPQAKSKSRSKLNNLLWIAWLIVVASIPDLDYVIDAWNSSNNEGLRITHSILFSLIVPCFTIAVLLVRQRDIWRRSTEVVLASLSHLWLDFLVGVTPLPLLFPLIKTDYKLPFGILPSAAKIDLDNYYFYRNLQLEMGVLLPVFAIVCLLSIARIFWGEMHPAVKSSGIIAIALMVLCINHFLRQNLQLPR